MSAANIEVAPALPFAAVPRTAEGSRRLLIATGLLVSAATIRSLRLEVAGLFVPLYVIPILLAIPIVAPRLGEFPSRVRGALTIFFVLFAFSVLRYGSNFGDLVKMTTSVMTLIAVTLMVGRRAHFADAVVALSASLVVININGFRTGFVADVGYQPLQDLANKNAYSIYALPIVLLAGFCLLHFKTGIVAKALMGGGIVTTAFLLFSGANRSGWGGLVLIAAALAIHARRWRALGLVGALSLSSYLAVAAIGTSEIFDRRVQQTTEGYASDDMRVSMVFTALEIAVDDPILGVTPQGLAFEMGRRIDADTPVLDTHNFIGYIAGGSGFPALMALLAIGVVLWRRPPEARSREALAAHDLVRLVLILFVARGMFSREVFFVGPFPIAMGLALGLLRASQDEGESAVST